MDNKFMNLKKEYRDFVKKSSQMIKNINIEEELTKEKCNEIFKLYQEIYNMLETSSNLNINVCCQKSQKSKLVFYQININ